MSSGSASHNKAKIAGRMIEVLEYFDEHREATVMDIVRHYDRPQSSTSELLRSLAELGLLRKNPDARSYSLTARAGLLGVAGQDAVVRDGSLIRQLDRLVARTGLSVALFGMVGLCSQVVSWHRGTRCHTGAIRGIHAGKREPLLDTAAGWLLLSTLAPQRRDGIVRRLNAEATEDRKFSVAEMRRRLQQCYDSGFVEGPAGFGLRGQIMATLVPAETCKHTMAVGFIYSIADGVNPLHLRECLRDAVREISAPDQSQTTDMKHFSNVAERPLRFV